MNGEVGKHLQSYLPIALVASWLYVGQEKEGEFRARGLVSVLAAKRFFEFLLYIRPYFLDLLLFSHPTSLYRVHNVS